MNLDEQSLRDALHGIAADPSADLASRARRGGQRRVVRRRAGVATGVLAVGAAAVPITNAVRSLGSHDDVGAANRHHSPRVYPGLYAVPPAPGSQCNSGDDVISAASAYPELLLLPPTGQTVRSALVRTQIRHCPFPHVALTAVQSHGSSATNAGLVLYGPDAPTAAEDGRDLPGSHFYGQTGHADIDGQPAKEYTVTNSEQTDAYWTEPDGGQWHAIIHDLPQAQAVALLNGLRIDSLAGSAVLADAGKDGWTIEPAVADRPRADRGVVYTEWTDAEGHVLGMTVTETPSRVEQDAIAEGGTLSFGTVRGHRASVVGGQTPGLEWQESANAEVALGPAEGSENVSAAELEQAAQALSLASPSDPRFHG